MAVPRVAPHYASWGTVAADEITPDMLDDTADYAMTSLTTNSLIGAGAAAMVISGVDGYDVKVTLGDDDGTESFIIEEVDGDDLFKVGSTGLVTLLNGAEFDNVTSATELKISETNIKTVGIRKQIGEWTTRNAADNSMYTAVAASSGHERLIKMASNIVSNDGGYYETLFVNTKVASTDTPGGTIRASEHKVTIEGNCAANAIATGVYAKINCSGASAEVSQAYGVHVLMEEESSGTITAGTGVLVEGGNGVLDYGIDVAGQVRKAPIRLLKGTGGAITAATIAGSNIGITEGALAGDDGIVGLYLDTADSNAVSLVCKYGGLFYHVKLTDTAAS